jgi:exoribonuclease-2
MLVIYEEDGEYKLGSVLADNASSLQVESPHGKRSKIKSGNVLLRFDGVSGSDFMSHANKLAEAIEVDFLWECCGDDEFGFTDMAREYHGRGATALESTAVLLRLHSAPVYFHRKGKGRYRRAPPDILRAALAAVERKRQQQTQVQSYVEQLCRNELPAEFTPQLSRLLYKPDANALETKALAQAAAQLKLEPLKLLERCGAIPSSHDYHLNAFLFEHFPRGTVFPDGSLTLPDGLPCADVAAFSIDDITTTEIDDAFSVTARDAGGYRIGIHIAAPGLAIEVDSVLDIEARRRMSTVYFPGNKITMLPEAASTLFSLTAGGARPALSLYLEVDAQMVVTATESRIEMVPVTDNLRLSNIEEQIEHGLRQPERLSELPHGEALRVLLNLSGAFERQRGKNQAPPDRPEYSFYVEDDRVRIVERRRGSAVDRLVSELMIYVNASWGGLLERHGTAGIYRAQSDGKVRLSTVPAPHEGLGVARYAWASSPLRRYVDLVNQRQLIATLRGVPPPFVANDDALFAIVRGFELDYAQYGEFQDRMERYWCLRYLLQENLHDCAAIVTRDGWARLAHIPLYLKPTGMPSLPPGSRVRLDVDVVDLLDLSVRMGFRELHAN